MNSTEVEMESLKNNELYQKVISGFKSAPFEESPAMTQGFLLGLISRGRNSSDPQALKLTIDILNGGNTLSGSGIALFTTMMIELERELKSKKLKLFVPAASEQSTSDRIAHLAELSYGFTLSMYCENTPYVGSLIEKDYVENNRLLNEKLQLINDVSELDPYSDCEEEDFKLVYDETVDSIVTIYSLFHKV